MKEFVSFLFSERMYRAIGMGGADSCRQWAAKICNRLKGVYHDCGYLPVSLNLSLPASSDHTILNFDAFLYVFLTGFQDPLVEDMLCDTALSHVYGMMNCRGTYGYRLTSSVPCTWISKSFNAKVIHDWLCARGHYSYEENVVSKAKFLLERGQQGFTDYWGTEDAAVDSLILYPRGVAAVNLVEMPPKMVNFLYERWLKRKSDPGGYQSWLSAISSGVSVNQATQNIRHSNEYAERFVDETFRQIFGHAQDPEGHQCYVNAITSWAMTDVEVRLEFEEYRQKHHN
jgi:hypothetical protein